MKNSLVTIKKDLYSNDAINCVYAIRACCIKHISDSEIIKQLQKLKSDDRVAMMSRISDSAVVALDILGIEKYQGTDPKIIEMIKTEYYSN